MEELRAIIRIGVIASLSLAAASCGFIGRPNYFPSRMFRLAPSPFTVEDLKRIDQVAAQVGFVVKPLSNADKAQRLNYRDGTKRLIAAWFWPERPSMSVAAIQKESDGTVELNFSDDMTDGFSLTGANCNKYLQFLAAMKAEFGADHLQGNFACATSLVLPS